MDFGMHKYMTALVWDSDWITKMLDPLPGNKILDRSDLKQIEDDIL